MKKMLGDVKNFSTTIDLTKARKSNGNGKTADEAFQGAWQSSTQSSVEDKLYPSHMIKGKVSHYHATATVRGIDRVMFNLICVITEFSLYGVIYSELFKKDSTLFFAATIASFAIFMIYCFAICLFGWRGFSGKCGIEEAYIKKWDADKGLFYLISEDEIKKKHPTKYNEEMEIIENHKTTGKKIIYALQLIAWAVLILVIFAVKSTE